MAVVAVEAVLQAAAVETVVEAVGLEAVVTATVAKGVEVVLRAVVWVVEGLVVELAVEAERQRSTARSRPPF